MNLIGSWSDAEFNGFKEILIKLTKDASTNGQLINLDKEELKKFYKMAAKRYTLGSKSISYAKQRPDITPQFVNIAEAEDDKLGYDRCLELETITYQLYEAFRDTRIARGSELLTKLALPFRNAVKIAVSSNVVGANAIDDDLEQYFDLPSQPDGGDDTPPVG